MRIGVKHRRESRDISTIMARDARRVQRGLEAIGETLHLESLSLVPVDTSALMESSRVRTEGIGFEAVVFVGYGIKGEVYTRYSEKENKTVVREPAAYAVIVHQDPTLTHTIGQYNFLEQPRTGKLTEMREAFRLAYSTAEV